MKIYNVIKTVIKESKKSIRSPYFWRGFLDGLVIALPVAGFMCSTFLFVIYFFHHDKEGLIILVMFYPIYIWYFWNRYKANEINRIHKKLGKLWNRLAELREKERKY